MPLPASGQTAAANPTVEPADLEPQVQTALSLAHAATTALLNLSPLSHREIVGALTAELSRLEAMDEARAAAAVEVVARYLREAA
jgi:hypothetical protein